jgi:hypothetical protein
LTAPVAYRIQGTKEVDGKKLLVFEMHRAGQITNTDLLTVDEKGVQCWARIDEAGHVIKLDPPQPIVGSPVAVGTTWDFDGDAAGAKVHQHFEIVGQGDINIPAGTFRAFRVEPSLTGGSLLRSNGRIQVWISDDAQRLLVQLRARLFVGTISATLQQIEHK